MRNKVAKKLKRVAESLTIGKSKAQTRKLYRKMKDNYRLLRLHKKSPEGLVQ